jgi:hypothetical protein
MDNQGSAPVSAVRFPFRALAQVDRPDPYQCTVRIAAISAKYQALIVPAGLGPVPGLVRGFLALVEQSTPLRFIQAMEHTSNVRTEHYARPDVFTLTVNRQRQRSVKFT